MSGDIAVTLPKIWLLTLASGLGAAIFGGVIYLVQMDARMQNLEQRYEERTEVVTRLVSSINSIERSLSRIRASAEITNNRLDTMIEVITGRFGPPPAPNSGIPLP